MSSNNTTIPFGSKVAKEYPVAFKFEISRHGARAPYLVTPQYNIEKEFKLGPEQLTPQGMR